jgi:thioredoxin reductase (NADPH)
MKSNIDVIVVGAGPAGMSASINLKRAGLNVLVLEKATPGGQINMALKVDNYPGLDEFAGYEFALSLYKKMNELEIKVQFDTVIDIVKKDNLFKVITEKNEYIAKAVVIATGRSAGKLGLDSEESLIGKGISYCVLCDAHLFKNEDVAIYGDDIKEEVNYLKNICHQVYYLTSDKDLIDNVKVINSKVIKLKKEENALSAIVLENGLEIKVKALFINTAKEPNFKIETVNNEKGYIVVDNDNMTNIEGLFSIGDATKKKVYQLATAVGDASNVSFNIVNYLKNSSLK